MRKLKTKIENSIETFIDIDRRLKKLFQIVLDSLIAIFALELAFIFKFEMPLFSSLENFLIIYLVAVASCIFSFFHLNLYRSFLRHTSTNMIPLILGGSLLAITIFFVADLLTIQSLSLTVSLLFGIFLFLGITSSRLALRLLFLLSLSGTKKRIAVYGAGIAGSQCIRALKFSAEYKVCLIIDDDPNLQGKQMYGLEVCSFEYSCNIINAEGIELILLAMPSISPVERNKIVNSLTGLPVSVKTIPSMTSLISQTSEMTQFKDVSIEDLLGRKTVKPNLSLLKKNILNKEVLVTGAGGSIGRELCKQIIAQKPKLLVLLDVSEASIYKTQQILEPLSIKCDVPLRSFIGSVQDIEFLHTIFSTNYIHTIYHAAAYKHVPLMEQNILQAINNNSVGTLKIAQAAMKYKVESFTLISTDKAVNPTNVMGASKRLAELICLSMNDEHQTCFSIVRFGNVLGSSGSVVPLFKSQLKKGGPLTVTDPDITRYFMTISEAVQLVIQANSMSTGGEVFILNMGKPVKILELAIKMSKLAGFEPFLANSHNKNGGNIEITFTGLRPGEKMYEELFVGDSLQKTEHPRIMKAFEKPQELKKLNKNIINLSLQLTEGNHKEFYKKLTEMTGYSSTVEASDPEDFV